MKKNTKIKWIGALSILLVVMISGLFIFIQSLPLIEFTSHSIQVEINDELDPYSIIKNVRKYDIKDVSVDLENVNLHQLGNYSITYHVAEKQYEVEVQVVDTIAPTFDVVEQETDATIPILPETLVKNVKDATQTSVVFKEDYSFDTVGDKEVVVVVKDEGNNVTEKSVLIHILPKDETAPVIKGQESITLYKGSTFDPMSQMSVSDNQDKNVKLVVISNDVNTKKTGTYHVTYEAVDRSHNKATFTQTVKVIEEKKTQYSGEKVVYLTFDDGPSYNTKEVLKILDKYHIKATFFVTGFSSAYRNYIKEAYDAGHTIALHTYSHEYGDVYKSVDAYFKDLQKISDMVYELTGYRSKYIRFPGGSSNTVSRDYCKGIMSTLVNEVHNRGYEYFDWNISSSDASGNQVAVQKIIKSSTSASNGTLMILFHDAYGKDTTVQALPSIIEYYLDLGYTFKGIDENTYGFHHGLNN